MTEKSYTLHEKLEEIVKQFSKQEIMQVRTHEGYKKYTYNDLYFNAQKIARALIQKGINPKDKAAIVLENRPEWAYIYFGLMFAGIIAVPVDPQSTEEDLDYFFSDSESKIVFTSEQFIKKIQNTKFASLIISLDCKNEAENIISYEKFIKDVNDNIKLPKVFPNDIASILYTSGTTMLPKGVMLTHDNFYSNYQSIEQMNLVSEKDNIIALLPLHHCFPFMVVLVVAFFKGAMVTFVNTLKTEEIFECMRETNVTILPAVPKLYELLYKKIKSEIKKIPFLIRAPFLMFIKLSHLIRKFSNINVNKYLLKRMHRPFGKKLRYFVSGGAKLDVNAAKFLKQIGFTILEGYGLSETAAGATFNFLNKEKIGSVGVPLSNIQVQIIDPDKDGVGEIAIKGKNVMLGYYKNPELTRQVIKDGWFYSGDLGYLDKKGYLYITGRKKELIVLSSGKNIMPEEVEAHYSQSNYVKELCVFAVGDKGKEEQLKAVVVPDMEFFRRKGISTIYNMVKWDMENFSKNYPAYKRIMGFIIEDKELPRTRLGKLKRYVIKEKYFEALKTEQKAARDKIELSAEDLTLLNSEVGKEISAVLADSFSVEQQIYPSDHLELDLGFDSLNRAELITALEKKFNVHIDEEQMVQIFTVKELIEFIEERFGAVKKEGVKVAAVSRSVNWKEILTAKPSEEISSLVDFTSPFLIRIFAFFILKLVFILSKLLFFLRSYGLENLPQDGPLILCPNHCSNLDGFLIYAGASRRLKKNMYYIGYRRYVEIPVVRRFIKAFHIVPIEASTQLIEAMQVSAMLLKNKKIVCIFPEGSRSIDGQIKKFKKGAAILAKELNVRMVPVYIKGAFEALPRTRKFIRPYPIKIFFGKPIAVDELIKAGKEMGAKDDYEAISSAIRQEVVKLSESC